jgi:molecular chaperone DnaK
VTGWQFGVDFGTSYTVTAVGRDGNVSVVDVESNGSSRMPSSVFLTEDDEILVGTAAQSQAVFGPERFEPTPKRAIGEGEIFLGDRLVPVTELAAAVFRRVYTETCRQQGETVPASVVVTHPADWSEPRLNVLREAVERGGIGHASLLPEPVAAAARIASATPPGRYIAVYDFGGGTFDAAVLYRTPETFVVAGPPAGRDPLGGEDIDQRIITYIGTVVGETSEAWLNLTNPGTTASRRNAAGLRTEVQRAKETLSEVSACQLWIPGLERDLQLTRKELEGLIAPDIEATIDTLETAIADSGVATTELAGIYLVGGSSRIPLVASSLWRRLGVKPAVQDNPKSVVALGAASWVGPAAAVPGPPPAPVTASPPIAPGPEAPPRLVPPPPVAAPSPTAGQVLPPPAQPAGARSGPVLAPPSGVPVSGPPPPPMAPVKVLDPNGTTWRSYLAADVGRVPWAAGSEASAQLVLDWPASGPVTLRARDEPTRATTTLALAAEVRSFRAARTPGYRDISFAQAPVFDHPDGMERRFETTTPAGKVVMVERYLVLEGRAFVLAVPEAGLEVADAVVLSPGLGAPVYTSRFEFPFPADGAPIEHLVVKRVGTTHTILVEHRRVPQPATAEAWLNYSLSQLQQRLTQSSVAGQTPGRVLGDLPGTVVSLRHNVRGSPMLTKLGVAVSGNEVFSVTISLPHREQNQFASLARQVSLSPAVVATAARGA